MSSLKRTAVAGAAWTASAALVTIVMRAAALAVLTRHLAARDFGLIGIVAATLGVMQALGDLGLQNAIVSRNEHDRDRLSSLFWASVAAGAAVSLLAFGIRPLIEAFYREPRLGGLIAWLSIRFIITGVATPYQAMLLRDLQFRTLSFLQAAAATIGAIVSIGAAISEFGIWSLVAGELAQTAALAAFSVAAGARQFLPRFRCARSDLRGYLGFGGAQVAERTLIIYAMNVDYIIVGRILGPEALGLYAVAFEVASLPNRALNPVLTRTSLPLLAKVQNEPKAFAHGFVELARMIAFIQFPIAVAIAVFAP